MSGTTTCTAVGTDASTEGGETSATGRSEATASAGGAATWTGSWLASAVASVRIALDASGELADFDTLGSILCQPYKGEKGPTITTAAISASGPA
jgi:hypothetical protein